MVFLSFMPALVFGIVEADSCGDQNSLDPIRCRLTSSSGLVYALTPNNLENGYNSVVKMKYDLEQDPMMKNSVNAWDGGWDMFGKTAYDYTEWDGPLGIYGPLGPFGPLGKHGALPTRFAGDVPTSPERCYWNNWCPQGADFDDNDDETNTSDCSCVYGSCGPLGHKGALATDEYYRTMYHLQENTYWYGDYSHNLDASGVWGTQGPLGVSGPLGVLGALGPLGISLQYGVYTNSDGVYMVLEKSTNKDPPCTEQGNYTIVHTSQPLRYSTEEYRQYGLYEMYSRQFALKMSSSHCNDSSGSGDSSFGVDASTALVDGQSGGSTSSCNVSDTYVLCSEGKDQHLHVNLVPFGGAFTSKDKMEWSSGLSMSLSLVCRKLHSTDSHHYTDDELFTLSVDSEIEPYVEWNSPSQQTQRSLMPFLYTRLRPDEECSITVNLSLPEEACQLRNSTGKVGEGASGKAWTGYYLFVTGSAVTKHIKSNIAADVVNENPDIWGSRRQQDGSMAFNVYGPHQRWLAN